MYYSDIKTFDVANGPGIRVSLFVSGCSNRCEGCFQPETWNFKYGQEFTGETLTELMTLLKNEHVTGLSILGGDPFEEVNQGPVYEICKLAKFLYPQKDIWVWTGYMWEDLRKLPVMEKIDVLVDGPFMKDLKDLSLAYRGSSNQRVIDIQKSIEVGCAIRFEGGWK